MLPSRLGDKVDVFVGSKEDKYDSLRIPVNRSLTGSKLLQVLVFVPTQHGNNQVSSVCKIVY